MTDYRLFRVAGILAAFILTLSAAACSFDPPPVVTTYSEVRLQALNSTNWTFSASFSRTNSWNTVASNYTVSNLLNTVITTVVSNRYTNLVYADSATSLITNVGLLQTATNLASILYTSLSNWVIEDQSFHTEAEWNFLSNVQYTNGDTVGIWAFSNSLATNVSYVLSNLYTNFAFAFSLTNAVTNLNVRLVQSNLIAAWYISNWTVSFSTQSQNPRWVLDSVWSETNGNCVSNYLSSNRMVFSFPMMVSNYFESNVFVLALTNVSTNADIADSKVILTGAWLSSNWILAISTNRGQTNWAVVSNWNVTNGNEITWMRLSNKLAEFVVLTVSNLYDSNVQIGVFSNQATNAETLDTRLLAVSSWFTSNWTVQALTNEGAAAWADVSNWNVTNGLAVSNFGVSNWTAAIDTLLVSNYYESNVLVSSLTNSSNWLAVMASASGYRFSWLISNITVTNWSTENSSNWVSTGSWNETNGNWVSNFSSSDLLWTNISWTYTNLYESNALVYTWENGAPFSLTLTNATNLVAAWRISNWILDNRILSTTPFSWKFISNWNVANGFYVGQYSWSNQVYTNYLVVISNLYTNEAFAGAWTNGVVDEIILQRQTNLPTVLEFPTLTVTPLPEFTNRTGFTVFASFSGTAAAQIAFQRYRVNGGETKTFTGGSFTLAGLPDGAVSISIWAEDENLVPSPAGTASTFVDTLPPAISLSNFTNGFITNKATFDLFGSTNDEGFSSGPATFLLTLNSTPLSPSVDWGTAGGITVPATAFSDNATNVLAALLVDRAGNTNALTNRVVADTVRPVINNCPSMYYTNLTSFDWTFDVSDNFSGIKGGVFKLGGSSKPFQNGVATVSGLNLNNWNSVSLWVVDAAGNSSVTQSISLIHDNIAPSIGIVTPSSGTATNRAATYYLIGYTNNTAGGATYSPIRSFTPTFNGAARGVMPGWADPTVSVLPDQSNVYIARIEDMAGNASAVTNYYIRETTTPFLNVTNNTNGFFTNMAETLDITNIDPWSGIFRLYVTTNGAMYQTKNVPARLARITTSLPDTVTNVSVWCLDNAGNSSVTNSAKCDFVAPTFVLGGLTAYTNLNAFNIPITVNDNYSGYASGEYQVDAGPEVPFSGPNVPLSGLAEGSRSIKVWVYDLANNSSITQTVTTIVDTIKPGKTFSYYPGQKVGYPLNVIGSASDVNLSGAWLSTNNGTNFFKVTGPMIPWSTNISFRAPTNTIQYFAQDYAGNCTVTNSATVASPAWQYVGGFPGFSYGPPWYTAIRVSPAGNPVVAYYDNNSGKVRVMQYANNVWQAFGSSFDISSSGGHYVNLVLDSSGYPVVAYSDLPLGGKATVKRWNGSAWITVGTEGFTPAQANWISLALDSTGKPYIFFEDHSTTENKGSVYYWNGTAWVTLGSPRFTYAQAAFCSLRLDSANMPVVAFYDGYYAGRLSVMRWSGSYWYYMGGALSTGPATSISMELNSSGYPTIAYIDTYNNNYNVATKRFTGSSWIPIGGFSGFSSATPSLALTASGNPVVAFYDGGSQRMNTLFWDGFNWMPYVTYGVSSGQANHVSMALDANGCPVVAYQDFANSAKLSVMRFTW